MSVIDCLVIGGGQSGLVSGLFLKRRGLDYRIVDRAPRLGQSWLDRPDAMRLFTSRRFCGLPGLPFPGDPEGYPDKYEVAAYLQSYARFHDLEVELGRTVVALDKDGDGFRARFDDGRELQARTVINATGSNQRAVVPDYAMALDRAVAQLTAADYRSAAELPQGPVLVVGDGASGRQIAAELAATRPMALALGAGRKLAPNRVLGRDLFWWLDTLGIIYAGPQTPVGRLLRRRNPVPCRDLNDRALGRMGVELLPRVTGCEGRAVLFRDGRREDFRCVIWAVGYRDVTDWLRLPNCSDAGGFIARDGRTPEPGLYMVGKKWLSCRASELLLGAERDARAAVEQVTVRLEGRRLARAYPEPAAT